MPPGWELACPVFSAALHLRFPKKLCLAVTRRIWQAAEFSDHIGTQSQIGKIKIKVAYTREHEILTDDQFSIVATCAVRTTAFFHV